MGSAFQSAEQLSNPYNPNLDPWSPDSHPLHSSSPLPPSFINCLDAGISSTFLSPIGVSEADRSTGFHFTPSPQVLSYNKADVPDGAGRVGGNSSYIMGQLTARTSSGPSSLTSTSLQSLAARHPSPLTTAVTVGEGRSSVKKTFRTAPLSSAAFDLTMLERSAEFLCCLFIPLTPSTSTSPAIKEEDADIIRNHLTNLLGKQLLRMLGGEQAVGSIAQDVERCVAEILQRDEFRAEMERRRDELILLLIQSE
mmetsp:Transcript_30806/g.42167  ORF Transcript_30806/g.42167 Transcript_30806/m.42167 type:complete len:253 (-) Transcript_30806:23-781(-)